ncbi:MAG: hypothetical protein HY681_09240 [Chloroflexi bacterium]|nr:hypothetical protein [Chloroflexota bacterium]
MNEGEQVKATARRLRRTEAERRQLVVYLGELLKARGMEGTARELSMSARTLRRVRASANLTPAVEEALARHVAQTLASGDAPWWRRTGELEQRLAQLEQAARGMDERQTRMEAAGRLHEHEALGARRAAALRIETLEAALRDLAAKVEGQQPGPSPEGRRPEEPARVDVQADATGEEVQRLVEERKAAWAVEDRALGKLLRLAAAERRLEAELALIRDCGESWPLGQTWTRSKQLEETAWRMDALEANRREQRRLERGRRLRQVLIVPLCCGEGPHY